MSTQYYIPEDRVPLPPPNAKVFTTACDYCIVGCGYKAYRWPLGTEGGPKGKDNAFGVDFPTDALSGFWPGTNNHNVVMVNGMPHNVMVLADGDIGAVNLGGDHSIRGGAIAQKCYNPQKPTGDRLKRPMVRIFDTLMPVSWDFALDIAAELSQYVLDNYAESAWAQKTYSYQFYENTYAVTKLSLRHINTPAWSPHDQPGPGAATAGFRDTGFDNFAPAYWDWGNADTLFISGTDPYETKTIVFNQWILPAMRRKKNPMKVIYALPRKTTGAAYAEANGGLFLQVTPGSDTALHMAISRVIVENGWEDKEWIEKWTANKWETDAGFGQGTRNTPWQWRTTWGKFESKGFDDWKKWLLKQKESELKTASKITGVPAKKIKKAAEMMAKPRGGRRVKTSIGIEKGNYWSNNYLNVASISSLAVCCGTGNRPGQMIGRFGGHQRGGRKGGGYPRAKSPEKQEGRRKKPIDLDRWVMSGHVRFAHVIGTTWVSAMGGTQGLQAKFTELTRNNPNQVRSLDKKEIIKTLKKRVDSGGMVVVNQDIYLRNPIGAVYADIVLPAATWGEEDFTRANGERRLRVYSKFYDAPGDAKPDWWIAAKWGKKMGFEGFDWKSSADVFQETARFSRKSRVAYHNLVWVAKKNGMKGHDLLRKFGTTGIQAPVLFVDEQFKEKRPGNEYVGDDQVKIGYKGGKLIGTVRMHDSQRKLPETGPRDMTVYTKWLTHFKSQSGKLNLMKSPWGMWADFYDWWKPKGNELWVINGRINEIWQSGFDDLLRRPYITQRWPENFLEVHPDDAAKRGIESGDMVSIINDRVPVQKDTNVAVFSGDLLFSQLVKQGHIKFVKGSITAVVMVTPAVKKGVSFTYFLHPQQSANSLVAMVPDPITNRYRFKLGIGKVKKIGVSPFKKELRAMSFVRRDIV